MTSPQRQTDSIAPRADTLRLGLLFGTIYFVQGIAEPTEGLIAQPVRSLLKQWGYSTAQISLFAMLLSMPWWFKPCYGLLSDFVPLAGYRRRSYLMLSAGATVVGLLYVSVAPLSQLSSVWLLAALLLATVGVAFSDVVADALMVEQGQPRGLTGKLQSIQWASMYAASVIVGSLGGYLSAHGLQRVGFAICAMTTLVTLILAVFFVREERRPKSADDRRTVLRELKQAALHPAVLAVGGFLFLWNFNPFSTSVLYMYMTEELHFDEQFYGHTVSLMSVAMIAASVSYGFYCRRIAFPILVHASIVLGILSTVAYWGMFNEASAVLISVFIGFTYMTANLIQFDFAARVCPPRAAATVFALLMALSNFGMSLAILFGGYIYEYGRVWWNARISFNLLVFIGAVTTGVCWLLMPMLARHARQASEQPAEE